MTKITKWNKQTKKTPQQTKKNKPTNKPTNKKQSQDWNQMSVRKQVYNMAILVFIWLEFTSGIIFNFALLCLFFSESYE